MRSYDRSDAEARPLSFELGYTKNADGSVLVSFGNTRVLCTAFMEDRAPAFLKNSGKGWVTAEYGMLPGSTHTRSQREAAKGQQSGRTIEIQRLIGRSLRTCVNLADLGERTITVDCDVLQADGGTRTASITGGCVALFLCLWRHRKKFLQAPIHGRVAAISLGLKNQRILVDLDYEEDKNCDVDMNLVMTDKLAFVEIQGTAEGSPFTMEQLQQFTEQGKVALTKVLEMQLEALKGHGLTAGWLK